MQALYGKGNWTTENLDKHHVDNMATTSATSWVTKPFSSFWFVLLVVGKSTGVPNNHTNGSISRDIVTVSHHVPGCTSPDIEFIYYVHLRCPTLAVSKCLPWKNTYIYSIWGKKDTFTTQVVIVCIVRNQSAPRLDQSKHHWIWLSDSRLGDKVLYNRICTIYTPNTVY